MKIIQDGETLRVTEIEQLAVANCREFQSAVSLAWSPVLKEIDIDLSRTGFVDCGGVGALIALGKSARGRDATLRLRNPRLPVQRLFQLTRLCDLLPIETDPA